MGVASPTQLPVKSSVGFLVIVATWGGIGGSMTRIGEDSRSKTMISASVSAPCQETVRQFRSVSRGSSAGGRNVLLASIGAT